MRAEFILLRGCLRPRGVWGAERVLSSVPWLPPPQLSDVPSSNSIGDAFGGRPSFHAAPHHSAPQTPQVLRDAARNRDSSD